MKLKMLFSVVAMSSLVMMTGCSNKTKAERDSLLKQNQDLNTQLQAEKTARADAEARAAAAANPTAPTATPGTPDMGAAPADTGTPTDMGTDTGTTGVTRGHNSLGEDVIRVSSDVLFDSGKAALKPTAKKALDKAVAILRKEYGGRQIRVEGYTDPNPVKHSGWDDNWDLGAARARAVLLYLEGKGVKDMYIASFGSTQLKSTKNLAADRRVEIVVVRAGK